MRPASPFTLHDMDRQQGAEDERDHQNRVSSSVQIGSSVCRVADGQPVRGRIPQPVGGGNCTMPLLLENFAINGKGSVIRLPDNKNETYPALRTPCNGYVPVANGLLYAVGSGCGCVPLFVRGMAAHGAARIVDTEALAGRPRPVERGPGRPSKENATGWTMYRADLRRSAATAATIGGVPKISWTARLDGRTRRRHLCCRWPLPTTWCSPPANTAWRRSRRMLNPGSRRDWESWPSRGGAPCRRHGRRRRRGRPGAARWHGEADRRQPRGRRGGGQFAVARPAGPRWPGRRRRRHRRRLCRRQRGDDQVAVTTRVWPAVECVLVHRLSRAQAGQHGVVQDAVGGHAVAGVDAVATGPVGEPPARLRDHRLDGGGVPGVQ